MAGEFTKATTIKPAVVGTIANPDEYNQNIAGQSKGAIVGIDADGNFDDVDIGDETLGGTGTLIKDIKMRDTGLIKFYNSSGVFQFSAFLGQATETQIGQAEIATQAEVDAGTDDTRIITPAKLNNSTVKDRKLISTSTISNDAQVDVSLTGFSSYEIFFEQVKPANTTAEFRVRVSTDGGSTFKAGGTDYGYVNIITTDVGEHPAHVAFSASYMALSGIVSGYEISNNNLGYNGRLLILAPGTTTGNKALLCDSAYQVSGANRLCRISSSGRYKGASSAVNALRIYVDNGNLSTGVIKVYGIK